MADPANWSSRVLVVDDDLATRLLARASLEQTGIAIEEAGDGDAGLSLFLSARPHLVLLNVELPGLDGVEICRRLRALPGGEHVPILVMTGLDDVTSIDRAYKAGATDFVTRPINWSLLCCRVRYLLRAPTAFNHLRMAEELRIRDRAMAASTNGICISDSRQPDMPIIYCNAAFEHMSGYRADEVIGHNCRFLQGEDTDRQSVGAIGDSLRAGRQCKITLRNYRKDGTPFWNELTLSPVHDDRHVLTHFIGVQSDTTREVEATNALRDLNENLESLVQERTHSLAVAEEKYRTIFENAVQGIFQTSPQGRYISANRAVARICGYDSPEELMAQRTDLAAQLYVQPGLREEFARAIAAKGQVEHFEAEIYRRDGSRIWTSENVRCIRAADGTLQYYEGTVIDITARKRAEEKILYLAYYDSLTGLPNRQSFVEHLERTQALARRHGRMMAVLFLDLDNFKRINDTLGHTAGDRILEAVAERLTTSVRDSDCIARDLEPQINRDVARFGGDEFIVLLTEINHIEDAARVARRILNTLSQPMVLGGQELFVTPSIGIGVFPHDGHDADSLLKNADAAMCHAKEAGRNTYQFYAASMNARALERLGLESRLRKALEHGELLLHYQPQVEVVSGEIVGVEALIRWQNPELGLVSPTEFIPLAEDSGMIVAIGEWVLRTACAQNMAWQNAGCARVRVAVNISGLQFRRSGLVETVQRILAETGLPPEFLELELTESTIMRNAGETIAALQRFKRMSISLSIDDFGTGYSSLSYLKRFPLDTLKIDASFVRDITDDADDKSITTAIIAMAHGLGLKVIAEGVETETQLAFLRKHGCDEVQGFFFSKPLPVDECAELICAPRPFASKASLG
ncbi:MAG: EAL domain-containing protein [Gammaproteobacteria bacterium]